MNTPVPTTLAVVLRTLLLLAIVLLLASYSAFKVRRGDWTSMWAEVPISGVTADTGYAYRARTGLPDLSSRDRPSPAQVVEDGRGLALSNQPQQAVRESGQGRFVFLDDEVYFSASDNSDPSTNGLEYSLIYPRVARSVARAIYLSFAIVALLAVLASAWTWRAGGLAGWLLASGAVAIWRAMAAAHGAVQRRGRTMFGDPARQRTALFVLLGAWAFAGVLVAASEAMFFTRTGQWTMFWQEVPLGEIRPDVGSAYYGATGRPELSGHATPSPAALLEDGVQVGLRNARRIEVRAEGQGRYVFWRDQVYFATTDNSDPRTNGRRYTIAYPTVSRAIARTLYAVTGLWLVLVVLATGLAVQHGITAAVSPAARARMQRHAVSVLVIGSIVSLVLISLLRASPIGAPLVPDLWRPILLLGAAAAIAIRVRYGTAVPPRLTVSYLLALAVGFYFMTVWAPHRPQGCHVTTPAPAWDLICTSGDSGSYYYGYQPGSTRQPLYPWFIGAIAGPDFNPSEYAKTAVPGTPKTDPSDALLPVVRAQIVLLLAAALVACWSLMRWLQTPLPAVAFLWMYDQFYFTAVELNIVLTESLVQVCVFLAFAAFVAFLRRKGHLSLLLVAVFCGLAYLTRQASGYSALLLLVLVATALWENWRRWLATSVVALGIFASLVLLPDILAVIQTGGSLQRQQESLQYQYRIAHALQYAEAADLPLMPDEESRQWLAAAIPLRDEEHRKVDAMIPERYGRMVYYIGQNLYAVATPPGAQPRTAQFFMGVATPILERHFLEYLAFGFEFWRFGMVMPGLARLGFFGLSGWFTYLALGLFVAKMRDGRALAVATLVLCHWGGVAISSLFAAPLARMVWASEFLVVLAIVIALWSVVEWFAATPAGAAVIARLEVLLGCAAAPRP